MGELVSATERATMLAASLVEPQCFQVCELPIPEPGPGQVRIKLEGCGVSASDVPLWEGGEGVAYPMEPGAPGHEGWGLVDVVGENVRVKPGQRVTFLGSHSFAEYEVVDEDSVVALPEELNGRPFPGEPIGCAVNIFERAGVREHHTVAIVGVGFLGALLTEMCVRSGARTIAIARRQFALDIAGGMGASEMISSGEQWQVIDIVASLTEGKFCDVVIECTGKERPLNLAAELCKEKGRLVVAGYHQNGHRSINMQLWNMRGLEVVNAHDREPKVCIEGMRKAAQLVAEGCLTPQSLFTHRFSLPELNEALRMTRDRSDGFLKALVVMSKE